MIYSKITLLFKTVAITVLLQFFAGISVYPMSESKALKIYSNKGHEQCVIPVGGGVVILLGFGLALGKRKLFMSQSIKTDASKIV